jgi:hypothetical protein
VKIVKKTTTRRLAVCEAEEDVNDGCSKETHHHGDETLAPAVRKRPTMVNLSTSMVEVQHNSYWGRRRTKRQRDAGAINTAPVVVRKRPMIMVKLDETHHHHGQLQEDGDGGNRQ